MEKHLNTSEASTQQVYIIQLDQNVQFDSSQAIPMHVLENDVDTELVWPLLQQKLGDTLQLLVEPHKESDVVTNRHSREQLVNKMTPYVQMPVAPMTVHNTVDIGQEPHQHCARSASTRRSQNQLVRLPPVAVKKEQVEKVGDSQFQVKVTIDKILPQKQKIKNYVHISDSKAPPRAVAVLPAALHFRGKLILPRRTLSSRVRFGPVQGVRSVMPRREARELAARAAAPVFLLNLDADRVVHIDVTDKDKSNWLGLVPLGARGAVGAEGAGGAAGGANVWLYEEGGEVYALAARPLRARVPLRLGYTRQYYEDHFTGDQPVMDLDTGSDVQWRCHECSRTLPSAALLRRHAAHHEEPVGSRWSSYRCKYCRKPFGRIFTLKRHMITHCTKRPNKTIEKSQESSEVSPEPPAPPAPEDSRIPSDESFHNFTNSLDFSTNLFDTDRIALDISAHSRADSDATDLNPYGIGFRDENGLSNDLGFTKLTNGPELVQSHEVQEKPPALDTCAYCTQLVARDGKSKHLRQCPARLICECGRVFRHKRSLAAHVRRSHPARAAYTDMQDSTLPDKPEENKVAYKCQECSLGFKRRGMLVNHAWRAHQQVSTAPVRRRVTHYACGACPRLYRSAAKRNQHVRVHHPGAEQVRGQSIESEVRGQPAACSECPRQYATRAKLLQHVRARHPHLAEAINKQEMEKKEKAKLKKIFGKTEDAMLAGNNFKNMFL